MINNDKFWKSLTQITVPFIPYISNCRNYGEFIFFSDIVEDPTLCNLIAPKNTIPVSPFGFLKAPTSDNCPNVYFNCLMDDAFISTIYPKIFE